MANGEKDARGIVQAYAVLEDRSMQGLLLNDAAARRLLLLGMDPRDVAELLGWPLSLHRPRRS